MELTGDPTPITDEVLAQFAAEHPELMEALQIFGIASSEYERALRALYPTQTYTSASTNDSR